MNDSPVRAFLGTDDTQIVPAIVHAESLLRSAAGRADVEVFFLQADHGQLLRYRRDGLVVVGPLPMKPYQRPNRSGTRFSLARYCIPQIVESGRALYFDSDQICFGDVLALWHHPVGDGGLALCRSTRGGAAEDALDSSVMVIDADRCNWRIDDILERLSTGHCTYWEVMCLFGQARDLRGGAVAFLDPAWNTFDVPTESMNLLHYTTRETQPWKNDDLKLRQARRTWEKELRRCLANHRFLGELVERGVADGYLKPALRELVLNVG